MKKFTLFFMSLFCLLGTAMAQDAKEDEKKVFEVINCTPSTTNPVSTVSYIQIYFSKDITVAFPEGGINVINTETKETAVVISKVSDNPYLDKNCVVFEFAKKEVEGKDGVEYQDQQITTPGTYSYTIPAGVIKSIDGDEFPETTFTFSIVKTFDIVIDSPIETTVLDKIVLTFDQEIIDIVIPASGMNVLDEMWMPVSAISKAVIGEDKKTVTFELSTPITTPGTYGLDIYPAVIVSVDGINNYAFLTFIVVGSNPTPSFSTNYKDGEKVKEIGDFEITFKNVSEVKLVENTFYMYLPGGGEAEGTATLKDNKITVTFDQEFTEEGEYLFHIPAGAFTMDGVANEESMVTIILYTAEITPLEILSVSPEVGKVDQIEKVVIQFNQAIQLSFDENWQQISREITMTCGDQKFTLTHNPDYTASTSDKLEYLVNAQWTGTEYKSTPITADGTYTLDLSSIVVDYAAENGIDEYGDPATIWNAKNYACEGTYTWVIGTGESAIEAINAESGKHAIYDILAVASKRLPVLVYTSLMARR